MDSLGRLRAHRYADPALARADGVNGVTLVWGQRGAEFFIRAMFTRRGVIVPPEVECPTTRLKAGQDLNMAATLLAKAGWVQQPSGRGEQKLSLPPAEASPRSSPEFLT